MKHKLSKRITSLIVTVALILSAVAFAVSYVVYRYEINKKYRESTRTLSRTLAAAVDQKQVMELRDEVMRIYREISGEYGGKIPFEKFTEAEETAYYERFEPVKMTEAYEKLQKQLANYADINGTWSLHIIYADLDTGYGICLIDISDEPSNVGEAKQMEAAALEAIREGDYGFSGNVTDYQEVGWLCSAGEVIYDGDGSRIGTFCVDLSLDDVMKKTSNFLTFLGGILILVTAVLLIPITKGMNEMLVKPINRLSKAAALFVEERQEDGSVSRISQVEVHTGDELEGLCNSMKKMEEDIENYIHNLTVLTAEKERIGAELDVATQIQARMLPCTFPAFPERHEIGIYATMTPAREVGGDFYDFFMVDSDHLALVMADVSGKGVPAALFMVVSRTLIKNSTLDGASPAEVLEKVNNQLCDNNSADMFVTVWLGIVSLSTGRMVCANAGHEFPALCRKNERYELFRDPHGFVLGGMSGMKYREYEIQMQPGEKLFVYTDGVPEATNAREEMLGADRMIEFLNRDPERGPERLLKEMKTDVDAFAGEAPQFDDLTMLSFVYNGPETEIHEDAGKGIREEKENG